MIALAQRLRLRHTSRMKSLTEQLWFEVPGRRGFVNITGTIAALARKSGVQEGLCLVNAMHITSCVAILSPANQGLTQLLPPLMEMHPDRFSRAKNFRRTHKETPA